jgi:hypothetical protein
MRTHKTIFIGLAAGCAITAAALFLKTDKKQALHAEPKGCVFMTLFGEGPSDSEFAYKTPEQVITSMDKGLQWIAGAQQENGGWGAGLHSRQDIRDPHAVQTDPATTSMVAMALLRTGNSLTEGAYASRLSKALEYLLKSVEGSDSNENNITAIKGTQIQTKLGANIDVILTSQFLTNMLDHADHDPKLKDRIKSAVSVCVKKIQRSQNNDGSTKGAGWAGVLQSSLATSALEAAQEEGIAVDTVILNQSKDYQLSNYNTDNGNVKTEAGAGIVLYSVSGSTRASAKEAREVEEKVNQAKKEGKLKPTDNVTVENLQKIGYTQADALKSSTAYNVYESAKVVAQDEKVMTGFGNDGGEEFISYLQTGESMIIKKDAEWKKWYDQVSGKLLRIQSGNGSWNGHHCITSPVFCTATCLLILSVNNDVDKLTDFGKK